MNRDDLIDVLTAVAGAYNRTVGETDIEIWGPVIENVPKAFALEAILGHLRDCPGVWLEPGHIYQRWKAHRLDQLARESRERREARQAAMDARFGSDVAELAQARSLDALKYVRPEPAKRKWLGVRCPWDSCRANIGHACWNSATKAHRDKPHDARLIAAGLLDPDD